MKTNNLLQRFFGLVSQSCFFHNSIFSFYRNTLHHLPCHRSCAFASTGRRNALCFSQHHRLLRRCHLLLRINHHQSSISNLHGKMRTSHKFQVQRLDVLVFFYYFLASHFQLRSRQRELIFPHMTTLALWLIYRQSTQSCDQNDAPKIIKIGKISTKIGITFPKIGKIEIESAHREKPVP